MRGNVAKVVLFDSGFWLALLDDKDSYHSSATSLYEKIENWHGLVPWPVLYEVVSTRLARDSRKLDRLNSVLRMPGVVRIDDQPYRDAALEKALDRSHNMRKLSLVDLILRDILTNINLRIDYFATFNNRDFDDICRRRRVPVLPRDSDE